jgi:hypothetical protein
MEVLERLPLYSLEAKLDQEVPMLDTHTCHFNSGLRASFNVAAGYSPGSGGSLLRPAFETVER